MTELVGMYVLMRKVVLREAVFYRVFYRVYSTFFREFSLSDNNVSIIIHYLIIFLREFIILFSVIGRRPVFENTID